MRKNIINLPNRVKDIIIGVDIWSAEIEVIEILVKHSKWTIVKRNEGIGSE